MAEIAQERSAAQAALAEAERLMKAASRDPGAFREAKVVHEAAIATIERLEWREKDEQERQVAAELQAKIDAMREAQQAALGAHESARVAGLNLRELVETLTVVVKEMRVLQASVEKGVRYETFGRKDGYLDRQTIPARIKIDGDLAVRIIRAGRELAILSGVPAESAVTKAEQGRL